MSKKPKEFVFVCEHMGGTTWTVEHQWAIEGEAQEVVRCRDCEHSYDAGDGLRCRLLGAYWQPDDFCSCGERRG